MSQYFRVFYLLNTAVVIPLQKSLLRSYNDTNSIFCKFTVHVYFEVWVDKGFRKELATDSKSITLWSKNSLHVKFKSNLISYRIENKSN